MTMAPGLRKVVLTAHVASSVGWLGAVAAYLGLAVVAQRSSDPETARATWVALGIMGRSVIVPLALASVTIGIVNALGTTYGLFRHYWVVFKLGLTTFATVVLLLHMPSVTAPRTGGSGTLALGHGGFGSEILHAGGGLLVLLATTVLSVYKPQGLTPYGWRKRHQRPRTPD